MIGQTRATRSGLPRVAAGVAHANGRRSRMNASQDGCDRPAFRLDEVAHLVHEEQKMTPRANFQPQISDVAAERQTPRGELGERAELQEQPEGHGGCPELCVSHPTQSVQCTAGTGSGVAFPASGSNRTSCTSVLPSPGRAVIHAPVCDALFQGSALRWQTSRTHLIVLLEAQAGDLEGMARRRAMGQTSRILLIACSKAGALPERVRPASVDRSRRLPAAVWSLRLYAPTVIRGGDFMEARFHITAHGGTSSGAGLVRLPTRDGPEG